MSDSGVRNWHKECPQLHEFVLVLDKQWAADQDGFQCKLKAAVQQLTDSQKAHKDWRRDRPKFRDFESSRRQHFENKVACEDKLRKTDVSVPGHVWSSYERAVTLKEEANIQAGGLKSFYHPNDFCMGKSNLDSEGTVGYVAICGWTPKSLANFDSEKAFHLPTPVGRFAGLNRDHTKEELFLALVVVRDAVCNYTSLVSDDIKDGQLPWEYWFSIRGSEVRIKATDDWVVSLRGWTEKLGFAVEEPAVASKQFVANSFQLKILEALVGKALPKQALADEVCASEGSRLYRKGGIKELMEAGKVINKPRLGYYRPDNPPPENVVN